MSQLAMIEVLDFLNSIEGTSYGGMASFEIARSHVRGMLGPKPTEVKTTWEVAVTGPELKQLRYDLSKAIGRPPDKPLSVYDMAKLCGLKDPNRNGGDTWRKWENGDGPSGPVAVLVTIYLAGVNSSCDNRMRSYILKRLVEA